MVQIKIKVYLKFAILVTSKAFVIGK